ncbi:MAG: V-type ATP synthase subunit A, partial [Deltaproteobacteria bacterium]
GPDALQDNERLVIEVGRIVREDFLQQDGFHEIDAYCSMKKAYGIMVMVMTFHQKAEAALKKGVPIDEMLQSPVLEKITHARYTAEEGFQSYLEEVLAEINGAFGEES